ERERIRAGTVTIDFERLSIALSQLVLLGRGAEVLEPPELRARLGALASDLSALYPSPLRA
ncbi:MAG TPA: DNA-binding transcriptional regulator, partial [Archangium sp.]|nr:DNA-binding transcriptional regulator [Archangium sp.]